LVTAKYVIEETGVNGKRKCLFFKTEEEALIFCTDCVLGSLPLKTPGKIKRALEQIAVGALMGAFIGDALGLGCHWVRTSSSGHCAY
jgi:uncharacterized membrane protein